MLLLFLTCCAHTHTHTHTCSCAVPSVSPATLISSSRLEALGGRGPWLSLNPSELMQKDRAAETRQESIGLVVRAGWKLGGSVLQPRARAWPPTPHRSPSPGGLPRVLASTSPTLPTPHGSSPHGQTATQATVKGTGVVAPGADSILNCFFPSTPQTLARARLWAGECRQANPRKASGFR